MLLKKSLEQLQFLWVDAVHLNIIFKAHMQEHSETIKEKLISQNVSDSVPQPEVASGKPSKCRVKVAIRVRPMIPKEIANNQPSCVEFISPKEIVLGQERNFKFDHVFKGTSTQSEVYDGCVKELIMSCFKGYNAAILAYGQTGSGKTFTMGTQASAVHSQEDAGIIPRVIKQIFAQVQSRKNKAQFQIKVTFLEIYNQQIIDLLAEKANNSKLSEITIREEKDGSISIFGAKEERVTSEDSLMYLLQRGGYRRTTSSTLMNDTSSRSHAIFIVQIEQHLIDDLFKSESNKAQKAEVDQGFMTAKFFFVDLAGSERAKKTGATGSTLKEGISINLGLLQLGNVISALSTVAKKKEQHITYRNSKLTRILQDSLGGNSNTFMIACVSPAESNFEESLNTLKYASKAMNIKNKPVVNRDPHSALIAQLNQRIFEIEHENRKMKLLLGQQGISLPQTSQSQETDAQIRKAKEAEAQFRALQKKFEESLIELKEEKRKSNELEIKNYALKRDKDMLQLSFEKLIQKINCVSLNKGERALEETLAEIKAQIQGPIGETEGGDREKLQLLQKYQQDIESLENELKQKDKMFQSLHREYHRLNENSKNDDRILIKKNTELYYIMKENQRLKKQLQAQKGLQPRNAQEKGSMSKEEQSEHSEWVLGEEELAEDSMIREEEKNYRQNERATTNQLESVNKYIAEKESYLQKMTDKQIHLEYQLIEEMREQYHQKIEVLEKEKLLLTHQKDNFNSRELSPQEKLKLSTKIQSLEGQLKDYRRKAKEQQGIEKNAKAQTCKIRELANQIKKFKTQKCQLNRKLKEDKSNFEKAKSQRIKQILAIKKEGLKKDRQIRKLQIISQKKTVEARKKDDQVRRTKQVNQTLKKIIKGTKAKSKNTIEANESNNERLSEIVEKSIQKILNGIDYEKNIKKYQEKEAKIEKQLNQLLEDDSTLKLKLQKMKMLGEETEGQENKEASARLQMQLQELSERIANAEEGLVFCRNKLEAVLKEKLQFFNLEAEILYNPAANGQPELAQIVKALYGTIKNLVFEIYQLVEEKENKEITISTLQRDIEDLRAQLISNNQEFQSKLEMLREEMATRQQEDEEEEEQALNNSHQNAAYSTTFSKLEKRDWKNSQRKIMDLVKTNRYLAHEVEVWRRKCGIVQQKYNSIRSLLSKDKNIGKKDHSIKDQSFYRKQKGNMEEINGILDGLERIQNKSKSINEEEDSIPVNYPNSRWDCLGKIQAHSSSILSMTTHSNILISSANKSLKIWDLQTSKIISDISGQHLNGQVRTICIDPVKRLLFTACQRLISVWDLMNLSVEANLKAHKYQVRSLCINGDLLFSAGKGSPNSGALYAWDLRSMAKEPLEQKQKNQDIFSFASHGSTLYYGSRNHQIGRINIQNFQILPPFEPPHMDTVTSLATICNTLVSGSKDKYLKLWSLGSGVNKQTLHASNDQVTTIKNDLALPVVYSGSRDGQIKAVKLTANGVQKASKLKLVGGIAAHNQSVNAICSLEDISSNIIVSASADRCIKLWQPTKETQQYLVSEEDE